MPRGYRFLTTESTVCRKGHALVGNNRLEWYTADGRSQFNCAQCRRDRAAEWRKNNPELKYRRTIESQMRLRYGINSIEERDAILAAQGNACAICGRTDCHWGKGFNDTWHIDHDPGRPRTYRGILCAFCNTALGRLEKFLPQVQQYLTHHRQNSGLFGA